MKTIKRLHHVQFTIPLDKVDEARAFYLDDIEIHVSLQDNVDRYQTKNHLALQVDDVVSWRDRLMAQGIQIEESVPMPHYDRLEFRDPFGNRVELIQPLHTD